LLAQLSDPDERYFLIPAGVARLRLRALATPVLVSGATRPPDIPKVTRVPEDYLAFDRAESACWTWFQVRPVNHTDLLASERVLSLIVQSRPPADDANLLAGLYDWEDYYPRGSWRARYLFTPRDAHEPVRRRAIPATFRQIAVNDRERLQFVPESGHTAVQAKLFYIAPPDSSTTLRVFVDGHLNGEYSLGATRGELTLPPIACEEAGSEHEFCVETPSPVQLWINSVLPDDRRSTILKRVALRFDQPFLEFPYEKLSAGDEHLMLHLFRASSNAARSTVRVRISTDRDAKSSKPAATYTVRDRVFDLQAHVEQRSVVLHSEGELIDSGQLCIIPLGGDIAPGEVRLRVEPEDATGAYLILSKATPGLRSRRGVDYE
jgi:hypothetical protein